MFLDSPLSEVGDLVKEGSLEWTSSVVRTIYNVMFTLLKLNDARTHDFLRSLESGNCYAKHDECHAEIFNVKLKAPKDFNDVISSKPSVTRTKKTIAPRESMEPPFSLPQHTKNNLYSSCARDLFHRGQCL